MDQLKEHRILAAIVGGLLLAAIIYFVMSAPAVGAAGKAVRNVTEAKVSSIRNSANRAATTREISDQQQRRWAMLRALYDVQLEYAVWSWPLSHYLVPGTKRDSSQTSFETARADALTNLRDYYRAEIRRMPPGSMDSGEMDVISNTTGWANDVPRAQKQFFVLVELVAKLAKASQATMASRSGDERPVLELRGMQFDGFRPDVSGLYTGFGFTMRLVCAVDVWPHLRRILHEPDPIDLVWLQQDESVDRLVRRPSLGIRFDRVECKAEVDTAGQISDLQFTEGELGARSLETDPEAQAIIEQAHPDWIFGGELKIPSELEDRKDVVVAGVHRLLYERLSETRGSGAMPVNLTITGEALDFLSDPGQANFWSDLRLSEDDVYNTLHPGVDDELAGRDERNLPECMVTEERTSNGLTRLTPGIYALAVEEYRRELRKEGVEAEALGNGIRLSDEAIRTIARRVYVDLAGGEPEGDDDDDDN